MTVLSPQAAAQRIAMDVDRDFAQKVSAGQRHEITFCEEVCKALGIEPNPFNVAHVSSLLGKHDIDPHVALEYPKMLTEQDENGQTVPVYHKFPNGKPNKDAPVIVHSEEEEAAYGTH